MVPLLSGHIIILRCSLATDSTKAQLGEGQMPPYIKLTTPMNKVIYIIKRWIAWRRQLNGKLRYVFVSIWVVYLLVF